MKKVLKTVVLCLGMLFAFVSCGQSEKGDGLSREEASKKAQEIFAMQGSANFESPRSFLIEEEETLKIIGNAKEKKYTTNLVTKTLHSLNLDNETFYATSSTHGIDEEGKQKELVVSVWAYLDETKFYCVMKRNDEVDIVSYRKNKDFKFVEAIQSYIISCNVIIENQNVLNIEHFENYEDEDLLPYGISFTSPNAKYTSSKDGEFGIQFQAQIATKNGSAADGIEVEGKNEQGIHFENYVLKNSSAQTTMHLSSENVNLEFEKTSQTQVDYAQSPFEMPKL